MSAVDFSDHLKGAISVQNVSISFGQGKNSVEALRQIELNIKPGEFVSLLGPSGCGKSTLVGAIGGFTPVTNGQIRVDGESVKKPGPDRGVVFQQHTLFPWKTIVENVEFGLKMRGVSKKERSEKSREILAHVGLEDFLHHYPDQLSGGMQQRVSLARVLVNRPRVLLMDEPFSALDAQTRLQVQGMLLNLWHEFRMTVVFVTHDIDEAVYLSDRVVVITRRPGRIKAQLPVELERVREPHLLTSLDFMKLKRECMDLLLEETGSRLGSLRTAELSEQQNEKLAAI